MVKEVCGISIVGLIILRSPEGRGGLSRVTQSQGNKMSKQKRLIAIESTRCVLLMCLLIMSMCNIFGESVYARTFDIPSVYFQERSPANKQNVETSLSFDGNQVAALKDDANAMRALKGHFYIKVIGYTDNRECVNSECKELSLRRAQYIYSWLIAHGVPPEQFVPSEGHGADEPVADNNTSDGRARNRRVDFQWVPISASTP